MSAGSERVRPTSCPQLFPPAPTLSCYQPGLALQLSRGLPGATAPGRLAPGIRRRVGPKLKRVVRPPGLRAAVDAFRRPTQRKKNKKKGKLLNFGKFKKNGTGVEDSNRLWLESARDVRTHWRQMTRKRQSWTRRQQRAFAKRVRAFRKALGWTQERLAREMGIDARTVGNTERCEYAPYVGTVLRFRDVERSYRDRDKGGFPWRRD
jgi:ribosome-binding protein aMBF1 (putative translation factor)